jgi:ABC-type lipoprotein export system ATPase subunit
MSLIIPKWFHSSDLSLGVRFFLIQQAIGGHDGSMQSEEPLILLDQVSKAYGQVDQVASTLVLDAVDLSVDSGTTTAIIGPSGSGKSSLLNLIGALDQPSSGKVTVAGKDLAELNENALARFRRQTIGFVFQSHHLLPQLSVLENVLIGLLAEPNSGLQVGEVEDRAKRLLDRVGLSHRLSHRPSQLSGGERQRVAVVRAVLFQPRLLLADEPTGALDHRASHLLANLLMELNQEENMTLLMVTHSRELADLTETILVLKGGKLAPLPSV